MPYKILFCTCMFNLVRVLKAKTLEDLNKAGNAKSVLEIPNVNSYQLLLFTMIGPKTQINQFPTDIQASCDSWKSYHTTNFSPLVMLFAFEVVQVVCFLKLWPLSFMQNYCDQYFVVVSSECSVDKRIKKYPQSRKYHPDNVSSHSHQTNNIILGLTTRHSQSQANTMSEIQF